MPITSKWDSSKVLFASEDVSCFKNELEQAVDSGVVLRYANLRGADLRVANLRYANLRDADLYYANLRGANLCGADLRGANLYGADLYYANLRGANLYGADLRGAILNWQSHDLISIILLHDAGSDVEKRKIAGLVIVSKDWCWKEFLALESPLKEWTLDTLAAFVKDGDGAPKELAERKKALDAALAAQGA